MEKESSPSMGGATTFIALFSSLKTMTYQLESFWSKHTPQYEKETKRLENNIMETTQLVVKKLDFGYKNQFWDFSM